MNTYEELFKIIEALDGLKPNLSKNLLKEFNELIAQAIVDLEEAQELVEQNES